MGAPKVATVKVCPNPAKEYKNLLDIVSETESAASALAEFRTKRANTLAKSDVQDLDVLIEALKCIHEKGRRQVSKVSPIGNLLQGYDKNRRANKENEETRPYYSSTSDAMWKVQQFVKKCQGKLPPRPDPVSPLQEKSPLPPAEKKLRRSDRPAAVTPEKEEELIDKLVKGQPLNGDRTWSKEAIIGALIKLEGTGKSRQFIKNAIASGKTEIKSINGMYKMYNRWKQTKEINGRGRKPIIETSDIKSAVKDVMKDCSRDSNAFQLKDMEKLLESKKKEKAEKDGLDQETVKSGVSKNTARAAMVALAMDADDQMAFTKKKLNTTTESRWRSEHSPMCGYSYATTVLSTHVNRGPMPHNIAKKWKPDQLSASAKETMAWMKEAYDGDDVYPVDPNLILSTDDTTLFVFEGAKEGKGDWDWKIIDRTNGDSSVRSDFQVGNDAENSGGLRVRLTVTFTASGLAAPPYVAVSGLTEDELSPILCPDGIVAEKVAGLCKGGNDLFNDSFGWLVFLRADKKVSKEEQEEAFLSIANKKFIHYNDKVLLPFIRKIRERLGWKPGQAVPEWLKAVSWFDGDIGQLQTMLYEAREALDEAERIIRNKHAAAATGTQQPCDLSPVFRLLKHLQMVTTAKDDIAVGLINEIEDLFAVRLRACGVNHFKWHRD